MAEFNEIGRVKVSEATDVVVSKVVEDGELIGVNINKYVTTDKYTGFAKGVFVPTERIDDFKQLIARI